MTFSSIQDRRQHPRHCGGGSYLMINDIAAKLVDWSFGGIGVSIEDTKTFVVEQPVSINIFDRERNSWETLAGVVCRVEEIDKIIGIRLDEDDEQAIRLLLSLLGNRLQGIKL